MKTTILTVALILFSITSFAQKYMTQNGTIKFYSEAPLENIESYNNQVSSVIDFESGEMVFSLLMKAFNFEKALMQEHFNEKYVESSKFPKATFKGQLIDFNFSELGSEEMKVKIKGKLTIHGVTNDIETFATLKKTGDNKIKGKSTISILLEDYNIKIPSSVKENISKEIDITIEMNYEKLDR